MVTRADYNFILKYGEVTPDGVAVYDLNSRNFVYVNRFLRQILGLGERQKLDRGESLLKLVHPEDLAYAEDRYRELLSIGCIAPAEFRIVHPDAGERHLSAEVLWLEESYTFAIFVKDITVLRSHEDYVEKISAQKDTLLDMILHNLSGPLFLSRDVMKLMTTYSGEDPNLARLTAMMSETTAHCIDIIQQFLQQEHTESLSIMVRKIRFNAEEKAKIILGLLETMNPKKKLSLSAVHADCYVVSDGVKFCQVLHNLLSNAMKYTEDDGEVKVSLVPHAGYIGISVSDNGIGIAEELIPRIFKERVKGRRGKHGEPSRGVGLFLCAKLVGLIGGEITLDRTGPEGTSITFTVPII